MNDTDMVEVLDESRPSAVSVRRTTWGEFATANRCWMTAEDEAEIERTLDVGREYRDGGGAECLWAIRTARSGPVAVYPHVANGIKVEVCDMQDGRYSVRLLDTDAGMYFDCIKLFPDFSRACRYAECTAAGVAE